MSSTTTRVCGMQLHNLIASMAALRDLAFFGCECRGVKFYGLSDAGELFGSSGPFDIKG